MTVKCERPGCETPADTLLRVVTPFGCPVVCVTCGLALAATWTDGGDRARFTNLSGDVARHNAGWVIDAMRWGPREGEKRVAWLLAGGHDAELARASS